MKIGTPLTPSALRVMLLGAGELGKEVVDQATQDLRSDVKGVTKHLYAVTRTGTRWKARVVLDV